MKRKLCYCNNYPINCIQCWRCDIMQQPHLISARSEFPLTLYLVVQIAFTAHSHCFIALWPSRRVIQRPAVLFQLTTLIITRLYNP